MLNILLTGVGGQGRFWPRRCLPRPPWRKAGRCARPDHRHGAARRQRGVARAHRQQGEQVHAPLVSRGIADLIA